MAKFNPVTQGSPSRDEVVLPIKKQSDRLKFKNFWLYQTNSKIGRRNFMIFEIGIVTGLRASDLVRLPVKQVYDNNGNPRTHIVGEKDKKTGKPNRTLDIKPLHDELMIYHDWLHKWLDNPKFMFFKATDPKHHIKPESLYFIMRRAGDKLGIPNVGSHSLRKTCGYLIYQQTKSILLVMHKLNQNSINSTLHYIDVDKATLDQAIEETFEK